MGNSVIGADSTNIQQVSLTQSTMKVRQDIDVVFSFFAYEPVHDKFKKECTNQKKYDFDTGINGNDNDFLSCCRNPLCHFISKDIRGKRNQRMMMILSLGAKSLDDNRYNDYSESFKKAITLINNHRSEIESDFRCKSEIPINPTKKTYTNSKKKSAHDAIQEYEKDMAKGIAEIYDFFFGELEKLKSWIKNIRSYIGYDPSLVDIHVHIETLLPFFSFAFELKKQCTEQNIAIIDSIDVYEPPRSIQFELERYNLTDTYTEGRLYVKGQYDSDSPWYFCDTLEDKDRGMKKQYSGKTRNDSYKINSEIKIMKQTAIPRGTYSLVQHDSQIFGPIPSYATYREVYELTSWYGTYGMMPRIKFETGEELFTGVLVHWGRSSDNTEGCVLVGEKDSNINGELKNEDDTSEFFKHWIAFMNIFQPAWDNGYSISLSITIKENVVNAVVIGENEISKYKDTNIDTLISSINNNRPQSEIADRFSKVIKGKDYKDKELKAKLNKVFGETINYQDSISGNRE